MFGKASQKRRTFCKNETLCIANAAFSRYICLIYQICIAHAFPVKLVKKGDDGMNGLLTEQEWRKQYVRRKGKPDWYGPQYLLQTRKNASFLTDRSFYLFLLMLSAVIAILLPVFIPPAMNDIPQQVRVAEAAAAIQPRKVSAVSYHIPPSLEWMEHTYTVQQLARGKLLLLDQEHRLPKDIPPPNTFSIASYGKGMIPVASLSLQSGRETIDALLSLFSALEEKGVKGLMIYAGTVSAAQQRENQMLHLRQKMRTALPEQALEETLRETDWPYTGEMLQEYTVEMRFHSQEAMADAAPLENTPAGQTLLQNAWRYGFVRTHPEAGGIHAFRFRYVGKAHATAMTFLDLNFEEYLQLLHEKGCITIQEGGRARYVIACQPVQGTHVRFTIPVNAICEASLDNTGYAVVACTI